MASESKSLFWHSPQSSYLIIKKKKSLKAYLLIKAEVSKDI